MVFLIRSFVNMHGPAGRAPNPDFELVNFIVLAGLVPAIYALPSGKMMVELRGYAGQARA